MRLLWFVLSVGTITALSNCTSPQAPADPMALVETEHAFAALTAEKGMRNGFSAFADREGIMFSPGAVNVKQFYATRESGSGLLSWEPIYAELAASGDLGFATGPWEYRADPKAKASDVYGHYVSIWKRQPDSSFKFVVDIGVSHAAHDSTTPTLELNSPGIPKSVDATEADQPHEELTRLEYVFSSAATVDGAAAAYVPLAADDIRFYREGQKPVQGISAVAAALSRVKGVWSWEPILEEISADRSFGYVYGTSRLVQAESTLLFSYVRIWRKDKAGTWRLALDIHIPLPAPPEETTP